MFEVTEFIEQCRSALAEPDPRDVIGALMREALEDPESVQRVMDGQPDNERQLYRADDLTVLNVDLPPGLKTPPHDHTMWAVIGIYEGQEDNTFYHEEGSGLTKSHAIVLKPRDVLVVSPEDIHAIANPLSTRTRGLHVYGGDLPASERTLWHPKTQQREPYTVEAMARYVAELMQEEVS